MSAPTPPKDRRNHKRYLLDIEVEVIVLGDGSDSKARGRLVTVSNGGFVLTTDLILKNGALASVDVVDPKLCQPIQLQGRILWTQVIEEQPRKYGLSLIEPSKSNQNVKNWVSALAEDSLIPDRRAERENSKEFPIKRRIKDYSELSFRDPLIQFTESLKRVAKNQKIENVVISKPLSYLQKRIRQILPEPRIITSNTLDEEPSGETLLVINLDCRRKHESYTLLDFDEYKLKTNGTTEPLATLSAMSRNLTNGKALTIVSLGSIQNREIATKFLKATKFHKINFIDDHIIQLHKRPLFSSIFGSGKYILQEVQSKQAIDEVFNLAAEVFSTDYNYSKEIDDLFTNHSDFYVVRNKETGRLINFSRATWHLPGHFLPCMLAHKKGNSHLHLQLYKPDEISYGEYLSPYLKLSRRRTQPELAKRLANYGNEGLFNVALTTYLSYRKQEFRFLSKHFGFKEAGFNLRYGDFGGDWSFIYCSHKMFQEHHKLAFVSPDQLNPSSVL